MRRPVDTQCYTPIAGVSTYCEVYLDGICLFPDSNTGAEEIGFTCGFTSTSDPTGLVNQDPNVQMGEIDCGPWTAFDVVDGTVSAASIEICGWIQVNNSVPGPGTTASVCGTGVGVAAAAAAGMITYTAAATDNVFLCIRVVMVDDDGTEIYQECALAISAGA